MDATGTPGAALLPAGRWEVDPSRSSVVFAVRKLGAGTLHGRFEAFEGALTIGGGTTAAAGIVEVASIATGNRERDAHLCAPQFFAAAGHPEIAFATRRVGSLDGRDWSVVGDLTIRDCTREVELIATPAGCDGANPDDRWQLSVRGEIDRRAFGLTWSRVVEATGAVGTAIAIELELSVIPSARRGR
jgi:polyisoprenoid-binding protein YceI